MNLILFFQQKAKHLEFRFKKYLQIHAGIFFNCMSKPIILMCKRFYFSKC
jgi:hypothetical protein